MMAAVVNKRQQARNERALQDLVRTVPGNDRCADCQTRNPGWASWSLGIFLCMRCAAIHRKLGTHISRVKSLSMDTWSNEQVEHMKVTGNVRSNQAFNPRKVQPNLPIDSDEVDMAVEKHIREKYQRRTLSAPAVQPIGRSDTGSTSSIDDRPPPVPAKNTPKFGAAVRAASSTYPTTRVERPLPPVNEVDGSDRPLESRQYRNPFPTQGEKLARLQKMGFANEQRNLTVLKGVNGNVDRAIETLIRLGEGAHASETLRSQLATTQRPTDMSVNPSALQHQSAQSSDTVGSASSLSANSWNPFAASTSPQQLSPQPTPPVEASLQNLQLSQQSLFPNNTGSFQPQAQPNPFLQTFTPPISPSPYQNSTATVHASLQQSPYQQDSAQQSSETSRTNPFLRQSRSQNFTASNVNNAQHPFQHSFYDPQAVPTVPQIPQWAQQQQRSFSQPQALMQPQPLQTTSYYAPHQTQPPYHSPAVQSPLSYNAEAAPDYRFPQQQQQPQPQSYPSPSTINNPYQTQQPTAQFLPQRHDKSSILALFNQPQLAPQHPQRSVSTPLPIDSQTQTQNTQPAVASGSHNPFAALQTGTRRAGGTLGHISEESRDFAGASGRHSPDAFAGLSARYR